MILYDILSFSMNSLIILLSFIISGNFNFLFLPLKVKFDSNIINLSTVSSNSFNLAINKCISPLYTNQKIQFKIFNFALSPGAGRSHFVKKK